MVQEKDKVVLVHVVGIKLCGTVVLLVLLY